MRNPRSIGKFLNNLFSDPFPTIRLLQKPLDSLRESLIVRATDLLTHTERHTQGAPNTAYIFKGVRPQVMNGVTE